MTFIKYKFAVFSALVLSMIIPFAGINIAHATQATGDPYHIGKVADGTYNETAAFQRIVQLVNLHDAKLQEKQNLEKQLVTKQQAYESNKNSNAASASSLQTDIDAINGQINAVNSDIDKMTQEYNQIETENMKLYYIDPVSYNKYSAAKDAFVNSINQQYWKSNSFEDDKNAFPLVAIGINHKKKSIEIVLSDDVENSPKKSQYIAVIEKLMPKDVPWIVSYGKYPTTSSCSGRDQSCNPLIGGLQITVSGTGEGCTLGFEATRSGAKGFVTAGHCKFSAALGTSVLEPWTGSTVGTLTASTYANNAYCDCAFVTNTTRNVSDAIFQSSTSTYTPSLTLSGANQYGTTAKQSGALSGNTVGTVTYTNIYTVYSDGVRINGLNAATYSSQQGDSGAPVTNGFGGYLYGVQSGLGSISGVNVSYYSPIDQVTSVLGANPVLG